MKDLLKFEGEYRIDLNTVIKCVGELIGETDMKIARKKFFKGLKTNYAIAEIASLIKKLEAEEEAWYVHYCDIGEEPYVEASEGFCGPFTKDKAYEVLYSMDQEKTIAGQNFYYNTCVVSEEEKKRMEKTRG